MSYFSQYSGQAGSIADQYGIPRPIFFGLIDAESSWNPNASPGTTSAYGFTQLLRGTAAQVGVDRFDPIQNLHGGAKYLSGLYDKFGNWNTALAAYHDGPGSIGQYGGFGYASKVLEKGKKYLSGGASSLLDSAKSIGIDAGAAAVNSLIPGAGSAAKGLLNAVGIGGDSGQSGCGVNPICYLRQWISDTHFFERIALVIVGFIMLFAAFYLLKGRE